MGSPKGPIPLGPLVILPAIPIRFRLESVVTATFLLNYKSQQPYSHIHNFNKHRRAKRNEHQKGEA